jgi:hypothetical protein
VAAVFGIRVGQAEATFVVDGQVVRTIAITPGQLDGVPGVHVGAAEEVTVSAFTVQTAAATPFAEQR